MSERQQALRQRQIEDARAEAPMVGVDDPDGVCPLGHTAVHSYEGTTRTWVCWAEDCGRVLVKPDICLPAQRWHTTPHHGGGCMLR